MKKRVELRLLMSVIGLVLCIFISSCFRKTAPINSSSEGVENKSAQALSPVQKQTDDEDPLQKKWSTWAKILIQAQAVEREAWWVLTDQKNKGSSGSFIRFQRAIEKQIVALKKNKVLSCEQFEMRKDILDPRTMTMKGQLFEACQKPAVLILDFESLEPRTLKLIIYPEHQPDVYGMGAAIFNKKVICTLKWNEKDILSAMDCFDYKRNRSAKEIVELEKFNYQQEGQNLLILKGKVTENLIATRKIETQVPLLGKITVLETELEKPKPAEPISKPAEVVRKRESPATAGANPDLLKRKADLSLKNAAPAIHADGVVAGSEEKSDELPEPDVESTESGIPNTKHPLKQSEPDMIEVKDENTEEPQNIQSPDDRPRGR